MKRASGFILLLGITALMAGCKLAVIVVEGGEVQSDANGTCVAGSICIVGVTDPNFSESFTAIPDSGWYFQKWNSGDRFFCGGSADPVCILSYKGYEQSEEVANMVASSETFYLMPVFKQVQPDFIVVEGREWLQPADFMNYSYNQISEVCPERVCSGTLPGSTKDLTGYFWASSDDARLLFETYEMAGRPLTGDFDYTRILYFRSSDALGIEVILSDPPRVRRPFPDNPDYTEVDILVAFAIGDGVDASSEVHSFSSFSGDPNEAPYLELGAWFWKSID